MSDKVIIPWRPRDQVRRRSMETFKSSPATFLTDYPDTNIIRIAKGIPFGKFWDALWHAGLTFKFDERTDGVVIVPKDRTAKDNTREI